MLSTLETGFIKRIELKIKTWIYMLRTLETAFIESVTLDTQQFPIAAWQTAQNPENKEKLEAFGQRMQRKRQKTDW